ncbi:MAG: AAA family ATPase [Baekduia sp.]
MPASTIHELKTLVASRHPLVVLETAEEDRVRGMIAAAGGQLGVPVFEWSITQGLRRGDQLGGASGITAEPVKLFHHLADMTLRAIYVAHDLAPHLTDPVLQRVLRDTLVKLTAVGATLVIVGPRVELPDAVELEAVHVPVNVPSRSELAAMLDAIVVSTGASVEDGATDAALSALHGLTLNQARQAVAGVLVDGALSVSDAEHLMERKVKEISEGGLLEYFPPQDNRAQLEGMANLKAWLDRAQLASTPEAQAMNLTPARGILLAGVPGCGKSLAAKHIAQAWDRPLLKLDAGCLYDKYIGETERNLRAALDMAEALAPIVLWIDEIEKGLSAGGSDEGGAVGRRMLGTFLSWLQEHRADIFVVATSNDLTQLPPELQRKGRFDEVFFVDLPTAAEREAIFAVQLRLRNQDPAAFDLPSLAAASEGFSGAEIEQAVVAGLLRALAAKQAPGPSLVVEELVATVPLSRSRPEAIEQVRARARDFVAAG